MKDIRSIIFDTETTGMDPSDGHRIVEIGAVELANGKPTGRVFHQYLNPGRPIDKEAMEVHGITDEFVAGMPKFSDIVTDFIEFIKGSKMVAHNAPFDVSFFNHELNLLRGNWGELTSYCEVEDTLALAKQVHPGQRNSLDALCKRYGVDNSQREFHGALIDSEILADVYVPLRAAADDLESRHAQNDSNEDQIRRLPSGRAPLKVIFPTQEESEAHQSLLDKISRSSEEQCAWNS